MQEHEHRDIPVKLIGQFLLAFIIGCLLSVAAVGILWRYFGSQQSEAVESPWSGPREFPPGPRLQVAPRHDLNTYLEAEQKRLSNYGWVDQSAGVVHIPIDRAMDLLLERGVPTRPAPPAPQGTATEPVRPAVRQPAAGQPGAAQPGTAQQQPSPAKPVERSKPVEPATR